MSAGTTTRSGRRHIPHDLTVTLGGVTFFMVHNKKETPADLSGVDVVVFGHSHKYLQEEKDGVLWLNPGSCGPRRFHQEITMMMAEVAGGKSPGGKNHHSPRGEVMELGLTFPLQRFLKKAPAYGTEPDRRFCWDLT
ncbi:MAG: metallophosphoesterase family protein [Dysosmobacter sp.]